MRCLVVADLHYSLPQFDWLLAAAPEFDVVIFAGDALDIGSFVDFRAQILVVKKYLSLLSGMTRVILCSGNHDLDERSAEGEKIARWVGDVRELGIACDGDDLTIGDVRFTVCPWWDGPLVKGRIEAQLRDAAAERAQRWIWVHHAPPANSPTSWGGKRFFGDVELVQWIAQYQPSMVISGHVHQSPFIPDGSWFDRLGTTWVFNTGLQHGRPPVCIVLDLDEDTAFWLAAGEAQRIDLRAPLLRPAAEIEDPPPWLISWVWVGLPIRAWRNLRRRLVDHALQEFADHREMVTLTGILMHQVGQIGVGDVEALRQQARDQQRHRRLLAQERRGVVELVDDGIGGGANGRGMRLVEQHRHLAEHRPRLGQNGDDAIALDDLQPSFEQHEQMSGLAALMKHERARRHGSLNSSGAIIQNRAHPAPPPQALAQD